MKNNPSINIGNNSKYEPNVGLFLTELRKDILKISIDDLVFYFNWSNEKYYQQIVNGYKDKQKNIKYKHPTVKYLFSGLNYAMDNFEIFKDNKEKIKQLMTKHLIKF